HYDRDAGTFTGRGLATVWDLARPARPIFRADVPEYATVALNADGSRLYAAMSGPRPLRVYDVDSGRLLVARRSSVVSKQGAHVDLSPDGSTIAVTARDRVLRLDAATLHARGPAMRGPGLGASSYSHDGRYLLSVAEDRSVLVWDALRGALLHRFGVDNGDLYTAQWSADDSAIYTTSGVDTAEADLLMRWRVDRGTRLLRLGEDTAPPNGAGYDVSLPGPEGQLLARMRDHRLWF